MIKELHIGRKTIYVVDGKAMIDCRIIGDVAYLSVRLTPDQERRLCAEPRTEHIQDILPEVPKEVREAFISGQTPAEWDELMNGGRKHWRYYLSFGYVFDDEMCPPEERDCIDKNLPWPIYPCPVCRHDNAFVNQCGCDKNNLPTKVPNETHQTGKKTPRSRR